jgi:dihydrofolate reductase
MRLSLIAAVSDNGVIGRGQALPWRLSADLRRFKSLTMGHHILIGRKTFAAIGRPLPGRTLIVISRKPDLAVENVHVADSLDAAVKLAHSAGDSEAFVIGGGEIYRQAIDVVDRIYLTRVHASIDGDTYFPAVTFDDWRLVAESHHDADAKNEYDTTFQIYDRIAPNT